MDIKAKLKDAILRNYLSQTNAPNWQYLAIFIKRRFELFDSVLALGLEEEAIAELANELARVGCVPDIGVLRRIEGFRLNIRAEVRRLWSGAGDSLEFVENMQRIIERGFRQAWTEGAAQCGIAFDELSQDELLELDRRVTGQFQFLSGFADDIEANSKANGGQLGPLLDRAEMWVNRYREVRTVAAAMACADEKRVWVLGPTEEHCKSCGGFEGRVYRFSVWTANGALPQAAILCCRGFRCLCGLEQTTDRITPGRFPVGLLCPQTIFGRVRSLVTELTGGHQD